MATMARVTATNLGMAYAAAAAGQAPAVIASPANGDLIPIGLGQGTLLMFRTAGTAATVIITSVINPPYGTNVNLTVTLAATDFQVAFLDNDQQPGRFDQVGLVPANAGYVLLNYTTPSALTVYAVTLP